MGKKRGGRRGKSSTTQENQPPKLEEVESPPPTSEIKTTPVTTPPQPKPVSERKIPHQELPTTSWARSHQSQSPIQGQRTSYDEHPSVWGRGRGGAQPTERRPPQGRGKGRGVVQSKPGDAPGQSWGGAKPKEPLPKPPPQGRVREDSPKGERKEIGERELPIQSLSLSEVRDLVPFKPGTCGRKIRVETNHFRLNLGDLNTAYRYSVDIQPEKSAKKLLKQAVKLFLECHVPDNNPGYDGKQILYSAKRLPLVDDTVSGSVTLKEKDSTHEFKITVRLTGTVDLSPLHNLLQKKNIGLDEAFQCVETVFKDAYTNSFLNIGRRFYTPSSTGNDYPLGSGAVMYLGGYQAAVSGWLPFLNVDVAHKAFTTSTSIMDLIVEMFSTRYKPVQLQDLQNDGLQRWQMEPLNEYLKGLKIVYVIPNLPGTKKIYKVNGLANAPFQEKFLYEDRLITVGDYFQIKWHSKLRYPQLPTLWVGNEKKRICVPMEYCTLKEGQPLEGSRLLSNQTSEMIKFSATSTSERKKKIQDVMRKAGHNDNACIQEFGFSISHTFEAVDARVLDPPCLEYLDGRVEPKKDGTWWAKKFKIGAQIRKWTIVGFGVQRDRVGSKVNEFARMILKFGQSSGMILSKPDEPFDYISNDKRSLISCLEKKKNYDLVVFIISNNRDSYYFVKQEAEQRIGLLTQCVKVDTMFKLKDTTVRNILLKINCKMNGTNHILANLDLIDNEACMVMGADVTHPSPQARTIPSVIAVTASHDLTATNYNIHVGLQEPRAKLSEIIQSLEAITKEKLRIFSQATGKAPKRIYFFRDGVSDGEFERVKELEIQAIKKACSSFGYKLRVTFIVVQKRHHTRLFPTDRSNSVSDYENVPAGTCVDTVITDPTMQNFYLMSHQSIKGVGRPTKYCVLHDENKLSNDDVEKLAYYLCHVYTRCNRSVSYPAPTYFAHLAADRAKGYLYKKNIDVEHLDQRLVQINNNFASRNPMFFS